MKKAPLSNRSHSKDPNANKVAELLQSVRQRCGLVKENQVEYIFKCGDCEKRYKKKPHLNEHRRKVHTGERSVLCSYEGCPASFTSSYQLTRHTRKEHLKSKPFKCDFCEKGFVRKDHFVVHIKRHSSGAPLKGSLASKKLSNRTTTTAGKKTKLSKVIKNAKKLPTKTTADFAKPFAAVPTSISPSTWKPLPFSAQDLISTASLLRPLNTSTTLKPFVPPSSSSLNSPQSDWPPSLYTGSSASGNRISSIDNSYYCGIMTDYDDGTSGSYYGDQWPNYIDLSSIGTAPSRASISSAVSTSSSVPSHVGLASGFLDFQGREFESMEEFNGPYCSSLVPDISTSVPCFDELIADLNDDNVVQIVPARNNNHKEYLSANGDIMLLSPDSAGMTMLNFPDKREEWNLTQSAKAPIV